jgi:hypothetical protein
MFSLCIFSASVLFPFLLFSILDFMKGGVLLEPTDLLQLLMNCELSCTSSSAPPSPDAFVFSSSSSSSSGASTSSSHSHGDDLLWVGDFVTGHWANYYDSCDGLNLEERKSSSVWFHNRRYVFLKRHRRFPQASFYFLPVRDVAVTWLFLGVTVPLP